MTLLDTARVPIECFECGDVKLYLVRDLVANDAIPCVRCTKPIFIDTDQWRAAINETADYYKGIILP
jgi:hypothetical protein